MKKFDLEHWHRKLQFYFFKDYEYPFSNISFNIEVTNLSNLCKEKNRSFMYAIYYFSMKAAHEILEFRLRIKSKIINLLKYQIYMASTVLNKDNTFSFCCFPMTASWETFDQEAQKILLQHHNNPVFLDVEHELALIHGSVLPWILFTGLKYARRIDEKDKGIPKFVYGKIFEQKDKKFIPMSVEVYHALMDGWYIGQFVEKPQNYLSTIS